MFEFLPAGTVRFDMYTVKLVGDVIADKVVRAGVYLLDSIVWVQLR